MFYLRYIVAELRRRRGRTIITSLGLAVGVGMVVTVVALSQGLEDAQSQVLEPLAVCRAKQGIVVITGWENVEDHKAFGQRMGPYLQAVGMDGPDDREHLKIARLGWNPVPARAS